MNNMSTTSPFFIQNTPSSEDSFCKVSRFRSQTYLSIIQLKNHRRLWKLPRHVVDFPANPSVSIQYLARVNCYVSAKMRRVTNGFALCWGRQFRCLGRFEFVNIKDISGVAYLISEKRRGYQPVIGVVSAQLRDE